MGATLIIGALLGLIVISLIRSWQVREDAATELRRSNARVLSEYKKMAVHRPHYIIQTGRKRNDHDQ